NSLANRTDFQIMEKLLSFSHYQCQKSRYRLMLSLWSYAPHFDQLCALSTGALCRMGEKAAGTEFTEARAAFPGFRGHLATRALSGRACPASFSPTGLCQRRTSGSEGCQKKTYNSANTTREFVSTT